MTPIWLPKSQSTIYPRFSSDNPGWLTITCRYKCSKATMLLSLNVMKADRCGYETTCQKSKPSVYELASMSPWTCFTLSLICNRLSAVNNGKKTQEHMSTCMVTWDPNRHNWTVMKTILSSWRQSFHGNRRFAFHFWMGSMKKNLRTRRISSTSWGEKWADGAGSHGGGGEGEEDS